MQIIKWCTHCLIEWESCGSQTEHRSFFRHRVDGQPGGRGGRRVRKNFLLKENAVKFARDKESEAENQSCDRASNFPVSQLIDQFTDRYASVRFRGFKFEQYKLRTIKKFFQYPDKNISQFRLSDGEAYIEARKLAGLKPSSINREINLLKRVFSWAVQNNYLPYSPFEKKLKHLKGAKSRIRWLTEQECESLLAAAKNVNQKTWECVFMALNTGFRLSNIVRLRSTDIGENFITAMQTKADSPYDVPISSSMRNGLKMITPRAGLALDTSALRYGFEEAVKAAGLWRDADDPQKVTFHTLRHTFAAYWLQKGTSIYTVQKWLGHSSVEMTQTIYGHLSKAHHLEEIGKFPGIGGRLVDTEVIEFPQKPSESDGPRESRTHNLVLKRNESCHQDVTD